MSKKYCIALDDYERGTIINCLGFKVIYLFPGIHTISIHQISLSPEFDIVQLLLRLSRGVDSSW